MSQRWVQVYNNDLMDIATLLRLNSGQMADHCAAASAPVREHILVSHPALALSLCCLKQVTADKNPCLLLAMSAVRIMAPGPAQVAIVWELNRLRHSLMLMVLAWANSLHDPATYSRSYSGPPSTTSKSAISALIGALNSLKLLKQAMAIITSGALAAIFDRISS